MSPLIHAHPLHRSTWIAGLTAAGRVVVVAAAELAAFYLLPLDADRQVSAFVLAAMALGALVLIPGFQVTAIIRSPQPAVRALEAVASFITLLLVVFAGGYYLLSGASSTNFTQALTRTDALYFTITVFYFTITVFSTVGFGDIAPASETARVVVSTQMLVDLVVLGFVLKVIVGAVKLGRDRHVRHSTNPEEQLAGLSPPHERDVGSR